MMENEAVMGRGAGGKGVDNFARSWRARSAISSTTSAVGRRRTDPMTTLTFASFPGADMAENIDGEKCTGTGLIKRS